MFFYFFSDKKQDIYFYWPDGATDLLALVCAV